ncbi:hypothetical protein O1611_g2222 [Lasiodiplodia mahajangana]|uniref:Uncharacterized protein n=1 Tax=Lasiodiplodia mahajangana TaxID=1108764 RepID=A0ACC2JVP0_9PEZI|nr:hypothetical protein O1611_g2222 [Lasiodiplodia mahajangana]
MANNHYPLGPSPSKARILDLQYEIDSLFKRVEQPEPGEAVEEFLRVRELHQRFINWTDRLGVFATESTRLDFRLQKHDRWHDTVWSVLSMLWCNLSYLPISGAPPRIARKLNELSIPLDGVQTFMEALESITASMPQPSMASLDWQIRAFRATKAEEDINQFEKTATVSLQNLYSNAPEELIRLLAGSMADRFAKLLYWQSLGSKLDHDRRPTKIPGGKAQPTGTTSWLETRPKHERCSQNGQERSQSSPTIPQQRTEASDTELSTPPDENPAGSLETHLHISIDWDDSVSRVQIDRRHVDEDLSPFVCISNDCEPTPAFSKYDDWDQHMRTYHDMDWAQTIYIPDGLDKTEIKRRGDNGARFVDNTPFETQGTTLRRNEKYCPLCCLSLDQTHQDRISGQANLDSDPVRLMSRHIAAHLQYITQLSIYLGRLSGRLPEENQSQPSTSASSSEVAPTQPQRAMSETNFAIDAEPKRPRIFSVSLPKNEKFTGREAVLSELAVGLFWMSGSRQIAIVGPGGIGKTQAALHLAYWAEEKKPEHSIFWISAWSLASFEQGYRELAKRLDIHIKGEEDIKDAIRIYLESREAGHWLLIVDNADDEDIVFGPPDNPGGIHQYLPRSDNVSILYNTRSREIAHEFGEYNSISLGEMSPGEATSFLDRALVDKYKQPPLLYKPSTAQELLKELAYFPLAMTQATAYLNQNLIPVEKYLTLLRGTNQDLVSLISRESGHPELHGVVATTFLVSMDQIHRSNKNAEEMLSFMSCLERQAIPRSVLPRPLAQDEKGDAIDVLAEYSFLTRRETDSTFDMNPSVYLAVPVWRQRDGSMKMAEAKVIQHLASVFSQNTDSEVRRQYLPHALHILENSRHLQIEERATLLLQVGYCLGEGIPANVYFTKERITVVIEILQHVVAFLQNALPEDEPTLLTLENNLAHAYLRNAQVTEAIEILERVVRIRQKMLQQDDSSRLASENNLAQAYLQDGRIASAINIFEHVTAVCQRILPEKDQTLLSLRHALANAYLEDWRVTDAIEIFNHIIAIEKALGLSDSRKLGSFELLWKAKDMRQQLA